MDQTKPIIALDFNHKKQIRDFLALFADEKLNIKIGMEAFYANGPNIVHELIQGQHDIFLDLKLHDIPNTVKKAMKVLAQLGVAMVNVHAQGGLKMMEAAKAGLEEGCKGRGDRPKLIAVTQLTSLSEEDFSRDQVSTLSLEDSINHFARLAKEAGLDGVVCSPLESSRIHKELGPDFLTVTPGIRLKTDQGDDQSRITTPSQARTYQSDYIVVGRPITQAKDPRLAYEQMYQAWNKQKGER
ncbi:Orotidine 5'-phosphate decarboxylase [Alloiococcus otitis]|uniref:Orotidine 5'-phosphate decarboxylase n=1 Tax=Alloiococcus otitis ATCC 51267 TaxID=883081 RepID=K9EXY4_9LACT|nr:orotidine-5'-phosphate decarboxylase [Alloiococcus otitis]EKU94100.1 orotidine 5'-phosphate decarboxylase [Alloiococcus otitis ATCC 51267]SUU80986.1 Orotidine 5'-phosphate decarboxylase [Alloiococcus otitis]